MRFSLTPGLSVRMIDRELNWEYRMQNTEYRRPFHLRFTNDDWLFLTRPYSFVCIRGLKPCKLFKNAQHFSKFYKNPQKPSKTCVKIRILYLVCPIRLRSGQAKNISPGNLTVHLKKQSQFVFYRRDRGGRSICNSYGTINRHDIYLLSVLREHSR